MSKEFRYSKMRLALYLLLALILIPAGLWQAWRTDGQDQLLALVLAGLAAAAVFVMLRLMFDARPAIGVGPEGLEVSRLGGLVGWEDIASIHLRWTKRRALWVIPVNSPELVLNIPKDAAYWRRGGIGRTIMRWLSAAADDHNVLVNLNGLAGGKPERVIEAIQSMRADLVREGETKIVEAD